MKLSVSVSKSHPTESGSLRSARAGLTLVEMLVAMALTVSMLALCTTIFLSASGSVNTMRGITEVDHKVRSAVNLMRNDLSHVYLRDGRGQRITPANLFSGKRNGNGQLETVYGPAAEGYFLIEENSPAAPRLTAPGPAAAAGTNRQGVDFAGVPVEIDVDDVLAMTVRLPGVTPDTVFRGRCPNGAVSNRSDPNYGRFFDEVMAADSPFDDPTDGMFSSPMAEVVYFLRPNGKQYIQTELNNPGGPNPVLPATYTLYRRQLLMLTEDQALAVERNNFVVQELNAGQFYNRFDLSVRFDETQTDPARRVRPNTPKTISLRRNRYGMILQQPLGGPPNRIREVPFLTAAGYARGIFQPRINSADTSVWFGRPTLRESCFGIAPNPFPIPLSVGVASITGVPVAIFADADSNAVMDTYGDSLAPDQREGEDILLTNVISFDVKVLDDDFVLGEPAVVAIPGPPPVTFPVNPLNWPGILSVAATDNATLFPTRAVNPSADPSANVNNPYSATGAATPALRPEFVDLGYLQSAAASPAWDNPAAGGLPFNYNASDPTNPTPIVDWGAQNAARWRTGGRNDPANFASHLEPVSTYDSWSTQYQLFPSNPPQASDDVRRPPYERPLRAIQITLRVLEPKTRIVREFQIVHRFPE